MAASPQDFPSSKSPQPIYTPYPRRSVGPSLGGGGCHFLMPLLHKDLILTLALTPVSRGVLAGSNPQLRVADTLPLTPSVKEWRAELGAHPATAQACTKWHNTERSGVFQNPPTPSSQLRPVPKQPSSGLRRQRGRKPKVATPGSLQPWNTERTAGHKGLDRDPKLAAHS